MDTPGLAVSVQELTTRFGAVDALQAVSLDVRAGELYGVIGPDGAGKTTLFRTIVTLLVPDAGTATVLGLDVVRDSGRCASGWATCPAASRSTPT